MGFEAVSRASIAEKYAKKSISTVPVLQIDKKREHSLDKKVQSENQDRQLNSQGSGDL